MHDISLRMKVAAPAVLRIGMSAVILWFGVQQIIHTADWIGFLPAWTLALPIAQDTIVHLNGAFEILLGIFMLAGFYTRFAALILALHLFDITYVVGYDAIGVRDFGLAIATTAVFLFGHDSWSFDFFHKNRNM